jgi:hypothetical protein
MGNAHTSGRRRLIGRKPANFGILRSVRGEISCGSPARRANVSQAQSGFNTEMNGLFSWIYTGTADPGVFREGWSPPGMPVARKLTWPASAIATRTSKE